MDTIELNYEEACALLDRAVEEKGEHYVYCSSDDDRCVYFNEHSNTPDCIVGHILAYKGVTFGDLGELNSIGIGQLVRVADWLKLDTQAEQLLREAQYAQDCGVSWGKAVVEAKFEVEHGLG